MSEWQPIETAPKDDTPVLVFVPYADDDSQIVVGMVLDDGGGVLTQGWRHSDTDYPTHWMPLPESPK